jgi:hypothetical protein
MVLADPSTYQQARHHEQLQRIVAPHLTRRLVRITTNTSDRQRPRHQQVGITINDVR